MDSTTTDIVLTVLFLLGMALFGLAMLAVVLRVGPKRGFWNQPAAELRRPRHHIVVWLYVFAAVHVLLGAYVTLFVEPQDVGVFIVCAIAGGFYILCGHAYAFAQAVVVRRRRSVD